METAYCIHRKGAKNAKKDMATEHTENAEGLNSSKEANKRRN